MSEEENNNDYFPEIGYRIIIFLGCVPLAMIVGRWLPQMILPIGEDGFDIHIIVAFVISAFILQIVLYPFRKILSLLGIVGIIVVGLMLYRKDITKNDLKEYFWKGVSQVTNHDYGGKSMDYQIAIEAAIHKDAGIEKFVSQFKSKYNSYSCFSEPILTSFALFDKISCNWNYQNDPVNRELFRPVSETINSFSGDCDDHAICLAACMNEAGARARVVHTDGHLYPELYLGSIEDKNLILSCIREIYPISSGKKIWTNNDSGELWISMDYSECYPGGKYLGKYKFETLELK